MSKIFMSYSRQDGKLVRCLVRDLTQLGADIWIDVDAIRAGMNWSKAIQDALDTCTLMILVISPNSMASANVENEWQYFKDKGKPIIPVRSRPADMHFQLHRLQYIDFSDQEYEDALNHLCFELREQGIDLKLPELSNMAWAKLITVFFSLQEEIDLIVDAGQRLSWYFPVVSDERKDLFKERLEHASDRELAQVICAIHSALESDRDDVAELICDLLSYLPNHVERLKMLARANMVPINCLEALFQTIELATQEFEQGFRAEMRELHNLDESALP
jgi:hypothetical protein